MAALGSSSFVGPPETIGRPRRSATLAPSDSILLEGYLKGQIVIVGPGRAGTAFAEALAARSPLLTRDVDDARDASIALLAVPDDAVAGCARSLRGPAVLGMLSGSVPLAALGMRDHAFVLHPMQSIPPVGGAAALRGAFACLTATTETARNTALEIAAAAGLRVVEVPEEARPLPHVACVFASNYVVTLLAAADALLAAAGLTGDRLRLVGPLIGETLARALAPGADLEPTGPVARGDRDTVARHLQVLRDQMPDIVDLYRALARATAELVSDEAAARVAPLLETAP